jgi:hypothetical protein
MNEKKQITNFGQWTRHRLHLPKLSIRTGHGTGRCRRGAWRLLNWCCGPWCGCWERRAWSAIKRSCPMLQCW